MDTIMELDELKSTWQALDRRLQQGNALNLQLLRDGKLDKARSHLRPLFWGQVAQIGFGALFVLLAAALWIGTRDLPASVLVSGIVVHAYGVACIVAAGITLGLMSGLDYAAPVLEIQKQLAKLRRFYVVSGMVVGLAWWLLWLPVIVVLAGFDGRDLLMQAPEFIWISALVGVGGLLATWWFHRWSRHASRPRLAQAMDDAVTGRSLRKAQRALDEIAQFEKE
ncbi:serine/threonine protein kinase [Lysobacter koreensis]|uniref:Serine/threonine protein kinase n=1 Tax=Lysobacter koreensis TaxID=266122 RepID=A0ABW2YPV0_9GAMM